MSTEFVPFSPERWVAQQAEAKWKKDARVTTEETEIGESPEPVTWVPNGGAAGNGVPGIEETASSEKDRQFPCAVRD